MKLGAEPKKLAILAGLVIVAVVVYFVSSSDSTPVQTQRPVAAPAAAVPMTSVDASATRAERKRASAQMSMGEFKPGIGAKRGEPKREPTTIDPTLRLDLLAKVQNVQTEATMRNLFAFGAAQPAVKPLPDLPKGVTKIDMGPKPPVVAEKLPPPGPPQPPPAPPITLKYYGYKVAKGSGTRQAFLLDGEDIILAAENDLVKKRYKIVKMDAKSITIEDTQFKHSQTLPLQEDAVA